MSRDKDLQTIKQTVIKLKGKLLLLLNDYDKYSDNYSTEAMTLYNELFNFNDAVEMLDYNDFEVLDDVSIKSVAELSKQIERIIYNEGNDVIVNRYGTVQNIVKSPTNSKTKFLNKTLNIDNSNQMLINARYAYNSEIDGFLPLIMQKDLLILQVQ